MQKVKFKYIFQEDYNPNYINGAHGGVNSQGEIVVNFYLERTALPYSQTYEIDDNNKINNEIESEPNDLGNSFVRVIKSGVVMNYQTAKEIHRWLGIHLESLEKINKK